jgi:hypothetical protein
MIRISILGVLALLSAAPLAAESCRLCGATPERLSEGGRPRVPLRIEIETALDMGRIAQGGGGGAVELDPETGARRVAGTLADLGGMALTGKATVTGTPFARVRIDLPQRVRLMSTSGDYAEVVQMSSDLPTAPTLDAQGRLSFSFGGKMVLKGGESGAFRGSVPISAEYE